MSTGSVRLESQGALVVLTIGAPPLNRIDAQMIAGLRAALDEVERVEGLRALVLRGAGDVFSAGADVWLRPMSRLSERDAAQTAASTQSGTQGPAVRSP